MFRLNDSSTLTGWAGVDSAADWADADSDVTVLFLFFFSALLDKTAHVSSSKPPEPAYNTHHRRKQK